MPSVFFFFFQAEDGIRDVAVTGVQTCALPISAIWKTPSAIKNAVSTIVSDSTPAAGFQITRTPTAIARAAVSSVQKNAGTSRAENIANSPTVPLIRNSQPM